MGQLNKKKGSRIKVKIITAYERYFKTRLFCYYVKSSKYQFKEVYPIQVASSICQLSDIRCDDTFLQTAIDRFKSGHRLFYCCDNGTLIAYGWLTGYTTTYYAWEIANIIIFHQPVAVLYDSFVSPNYRRRGIQKSLIHARINWNNEGVLLAVYAESTNVPSIKAITSCGFRLVSKLTHFSNKIIEKG